MTAPADSSLRGELATGEKMTSRNHILKWIAPIHRKFREEKCSLFFSALAPSPTDYLLDVGGGSGIMGEFQRIYRFFQGVTVVNLELPSSSHADLPHVRFEVADGCALPYPDQSFDWIFSNAVIEHVGGADRQAQFAAEIRRVAKKGYFVTTPNRYFPLEPHTLIPFYQFFPISFQQRVAPYSPGYLRQYEEINLLTRAQMRRLFPGADVISMGFPVMGNSLVATYRRAAQ